MPLSAIHRLAWIDWMRGLACVLMFQTHCYDAWLGGEARKGSFLTWSQLGGTLPAPLFLFLAGMSFALVTDKLLQKNQSAAAVFRTMARRGAEIFGLGLLFRFQEYLISWGWAPWSDLFRVDILNTIGLSIVLMALACGLALGFAKGTDRIFPALVAAGIIPATLIAVLTPPFYTTWRPTWLPWPLESYINGIHNLGIPQPWLFPIFPWSGFAFAGLAAGFLLFSKRGRSHVAWAMMLCGIAGAGVILAAQFLNHLPGQFYAIYDYWHTSPNFFLTRVGILLLICLVSFAWCRWGFGTRGFSPLIQLGKTSLLVYWVHIELVYGKFSILPKRANTISTASLGLLAIFLMMLVLSLLRTRIDWNGLAESLRTRISQPNVAG